MQSPLKRRAVVFESLEPRLLLSGHGALDGTPLVPSSVRDDHWLPDAAHEATDADLGVPQQEPISAIEESNAPFDRGVSPATADVVVDELSD